MNSTNESQSENLRTVSIEPPVTEQDERTHDWSGILSGTIIGVLSCGVPYLFVAIRVSLYGNSIEKGDAFANLVLLIFFGGIIGACLGRWAIILPWLAGITTTVVLIGMAYEYVFPPSKTLPVVTQRPKGKSPSVTQQPNASFAQPATSLEDVFLQRLRDILSREGVPVSSIVTGVRQVHNSDILIVTVSDAWITEPYEKRIEMARNLRDVWGSVYSAHNTSGGRIILVDSNGREVVS